MQYIFFYDETEHSRIINLKTVTADNYYDNFTTAIVGWLSENEEGITERYLSFEKKYDYYKKNGELKSQAMKSKDFRLGFASLNKHRIEFYEDLLSLYDESVIIYFSVFSKIEYLIDQMVLDYHTPIFVDTALMKYSIIKTINVYHPQKVITAIYKTPQDFLYELKSFLKAQIERNQANITLKEYENRIFGEILVFLSDVKAPKSLDWTYFGPFDGFTKLLEEMDIKDYKLIIDREGEKARTLNSAKKAGIKNITESDSREYVGIRMADMLAGLISKLMHALRNALTINYRNGKIEKTLLENGWFILNQRQLELYKRLYWIICENNNYWYKSFAGKYSDDLVSFVGLLQFMNHFTNAEEIRNEGIKMQPEYYNALVCEKLKESYRIMKN